MTLVLILLGLAVVGRSNLKHSHSVHAPYPLLGNFLCILGQLSLAGMFVYEEKVLSNTAEQVPITRLVGWEGVHGMIFSAILMVGAMFLPGNDIGAVENPFQALYQMAESSTLTALIVLAALTLGPYNLLGSHITRETSSTNRAVLDSLRVLVVWTISILMGWEHFRNDQLLG